MQNDMRDRLVKVIMNCKTYRQPCTNCKKDVSCSRCTSEYLADHLIANDVVPVVRCKDCIYNKGKSVEFDNIIFCHKELPKARTLNDYCSYGERKDNNADKR